MKRRGAKLHPNSGAGRIKWDGSDDQFLIEHKDATKQHALKAGYLKSLFMSAVRQGKEPLYVIKFSDPPLLVEVRIQIGDK